MQGFLRSGGGELVLETLVVNGAEGHTLLREGRYAMMRNVFFIPSCPTLLRWLKRCGFENIRLVDVTVTTTEEQRSTESMRFHSLAEFLDPNDSGLTCEGLPAPKRAIFIANSPESVKYVRDLLSLHVSYRPIFSLYCREQINLSPFLVLGLSGNPGGGRGCPTPFCRARERSGRSKIINILTFDNAVFGIKSTET